MKKQKIYVLAEYDPTGGRYPDGLAMYESDDTRLKDKAVMPGSFKRDKTVKDKFNGQEIGTFTNTVGEVYLVFVDYSVRKISLL